MGNLQSVRRDLNAALLPPTVASAAELWCNLSQEINFMSITLVYGCLRCRLTFYGRVGFLPRYDYQTAILTQWIANFSFS